MFSRPRFQPHFHVEVVPGAGVFLLSEGHQTILQGKLYEQIAPHLDGRPVEEICRQLEETVPAARVFYTLKKLQRGGYLYDDGVAVEVPEAATWSMLGVDPGTYASRKAAASVHVTALGVDAGPFQSLLDSMQIRQSDPADLRVVLTDHYLRRELSEINEEALQNNQAWLLVKPVGLQVWIGPLFRPGATACYECLAERLRANTPVTAFLSTLREDQDVPATDRACTPATLSTAMGLAGHMIASWITNEKQLPTLENTIQTVNLQYFRMDAHRLVQQPHCFMCGNPPETVEEVCRPVELQSRKKVYTEDGGHRAMSPEEALKRYGHHISPVCGAVSMLEPWNHGEGAGDGADIVHVYHSGHNIARGPQSMLGLKSDLRNSSAGKGINDVQAKASALCEGLERYSGIFRDDEPRKWASLTVLGDDGIHPNACMLFSERQYRDRNELNATATMYTFIPPRFDPDQEMEWTPVWSLTRQAIRYLPTAMTYFSYPLDPEENPCIGCSNGNAAGTSLEDAILQGFFEIIERDAVATWWYNQVSRPGVDLGAFSEPYLPKLQAYLKQHGRNLWAIDLTSDYGIPVFAAFSGREGAAEQHILFGFGAHLDPRIALLRAVTELNQMVSQLLAAPADEPFARINDQDILDWLKTATVENQPYLAPGPQPLRKAADYPVVWSEDLRDDILHCQKLVEERGMELLVLDQTRPEIGMPVVKVIVPGMRHFWPRLAPGRLYEVPVQLGWLSERKTEEQMNPIAMFL